MPARAKFGLDALERAVGFLDAAMRHQPTRRFRQPRAHQEDDQAERRADEKGDTPSPIRRQQGGIEKNDRGDRSHRGADPEAAVDDKISPAPVARRDQFLNRRIDRGVFPPMPAPVKNRNNAKLQRFHDSAVAAVATR